MFCAIIRSFMQHWLRRRSLTDFNKNAIAVAGENVNFRYI